VKVGKALSADWMRPSRDDEYTAARRRRAAHQQVETSLFFWRRPARRRTSQRACEWIAGPENCAGEKISSYAGQEFHL